MPDMQHTTIDEAVEHACALIRELGTVVPGEHNAIEKVDTYAMFIQDTIDTARRLAMIPVQLELPLMRLIPLSFGAAACATFALPAHAQRVDTRQIDIRETAAGRTCSFNAYRDLTLIDTRKGREANIATWRKSAQGLPAADASARMELIFTPARIGEYQWMTPPVLGLGFTIRADAGLSRRSKSASAALRYPKTNTSHEHNRVREDQAGILPAGHPRCGAATSRQASGSQTCARGDRGTDCRNRGIRRARG